MIITADDDIIEQIEQNNDASFLTQIVLDSKTGHIRSTDPQVGDAIRM